MHGRCARSDGNNSRTNCRKRTDKNVQSADENRMDQICPSRQCDVCQLELEHLDERRHDANRRQPYPNCRRKEAVISQSYLRKFKYAHCCRCNEHIVHRAYLGVRKNSPCQRSLKLDYRCRELCYRPTFYYTVSQLFAGKFLAI